MVYYVNKQVWNALILQLHTGMTLCEQNAVVILTY